MNVNLKKNLALVVGPLAFIALEFAGKPDSMNINAFHIFTSTVWIALWWITEAIPIAATALLPIILFPITGAVEIPMVTQAFGHPYIFLYVGGFILAIAIERWNLHKRIALTIVYVIGSDVNRIILGFMISTAFLSMWISNTATAVMMLPIGSAIILQFNNSKSINGKLGKALMLSIAYSASIGGFATIVGTPTNLVLIGILDELYNVKISFLDWVVYGLPVSIVLTLISWKYLTKFAFNFKGEGFPGGKKEIKKMLIGLGKLSYEERMVLTVFVTTALAWILRTFIQHLIPQLDDTIIAIAAAVSLFLIPTKDRTRKLMTWEEALKLPWGVVLLFGSGMALAKGFTETGLALWIGDQMSSLDGYSLLLLMLILVAMVNLLTEITSNLATTAMLLPVLAPMTLNLDVHPFMILVAVTVSASCAFMLPVATPPNAVVFGSGYLRIPDMVRTGRVMNVISIIFITIVTYYLLPILWDFDPSHFPDSFREMMD